MVFRPSVTPPRLWTSCVLLIGIAVAGCGSRSGSSRSSPKPAPITLEFVTQPTHGLAAQPFAEPILVAVRDAQGQPSSQIAELRLTVDGHPDLLQGTLTRPVVDGLATFDDITIRRSARDVRLRVETPPNSTLSMNANSDQVTRDVSLVPRHIILMIGDGLGYQHVAAVTGFRGKPAVYQGFAQLAMETWDLDTRTINGSPPYDPARAWSEFGYPIAASTDSASSATAMFTGVKTDRGRISVGPGATAARLQTFAELAQANGVGVGAVSSVPFSHATPAAWIAHNDSRAFYRAIADEMLFGDPGFTGLPDGGHGITPIRADVLIAGGHFATAGEKFMTSLQWFRARSPQYGWQLVDTWGLSDEPFLGAPDRLLRTARTADRLLGLFGGPEGNIPFRKHHGNGGDPEQPTLVQMTQAALSVLERKPKGFTLMVEGGAIDWASHDNNMGEMIGEMLDFDEAVATVVGWIEDPTNRSSWENTLLIITGDHETGYLTAGPGVFADRALPTVTSARIAMERWEAKLKLYASWDDKDKDKQIDAGEAIYWAWNTQGHSNSLIPCYFKGKASGVFATRKVGTDPVRGDYIDNTAVYQVMVEALKH